MAAEPTRGHPGSPAAGRVSNQGVAGGDRGTPQLGSGCLEVPEKQLDSTSGPPIAPRSLLERPIPVSRAGPGCGHDPGEGPPTSWGLTHPEHGGVDDERELEPQVGEARAVAHLLRVPAGHRGLPGSGAPGPGSIARCRRRPHLRLPRRRPRPRRMIDTREPQSRPEPGAGDQWGRGGAWGRGEGGARVGRGCVGGVVSARWACRGRGQGVAELSEDGARACRGVSGAWRVRGGCGRGGRGFGRETPLPSPPRSQRTGRETQGRRGLQQLCKSGCKLLLKEKVEEGRLGSA